ncbi:hypothetical protein [Gemmata sp.]
MIKTDGRGDHRRVARPSPRETLQPLRLSLVPARYYVRLVGC